MTPGTGNKILQQLRLARKKEASRKEEAGPKELAIGQSCSTQSSSLRVSESSQLCSTWFTKGAETILPERGLWPLNGWRSDGFKFKLECLKNRGGCKPGLDSNTKCCAPSLSAVGLSGSERTIARRD